MPLILLMATREDMPNMTDIYMRSFDDTLALKCFPRSSSGVREWWTASNEEAFDTEPSARFLKIVDSDSVEMIAYAKWNVPVTVAEELITGGDDSDDMPVWPEDSPRDICDEVFGTFAKRHEVLMGARPHYCK